MEKLKSAKRDLEDFLESHNVKDYFAYDEKTARQMMALSTFKVWKAWRKLNDICNGDIRQ
jgi:hypothetical protein